jgi:hypothetical protein
LVRVFALPGALAVLFFCDGLFGEGLDPACLDAVLSALACLRNGRFASGVIPRHKYAAISLRLLCELVFLSGPSVWTHERKHMNWFGVLRRGGKEVEGEETVSADAGTGSNVLPTTRGCT